MFHFPVNETPKFPEDHEFMMNLKILLIDEVNESDSIIADMQNGYTEDIDIFVNMADWLADITIYCRSAAMRYGIPLEDVINIVMDSNESKLGEDGEPLKDERGKVLKGVNYWKPEPKIKELIESLIKK